MQKRIAQKITKAIVETGHPLLDFRSQEAREKTTWIKKFLKPYIPKNGLSLDLGCGTGKQSFAIEELGAQVVGIDCSEEAIAFANNIKEELSSKCSFVVGDYTSTPFSEETFGVAVFPNNIIECSYDEAEKLSKEVRRILKNFGFFVLTMEDGVKKIANEKNPEINFKNGAYTGKLRMPDGKSYNYPTYFWTIPFVKYIFKKQFKFIEEKDIDGKCTILIFQKILSKK